MQFARRRIVCLFVLSVVFVQPQHALESIDTSEPIVRSAPSNLDPDSYFGFASVLHRYRANPTSFQDYLDSIRIVVSAPNGTAPNASAVQNTGLLYTCPITQNGGCQPLTGASTAVDMLLYDTESNADDEDKSKQFLGVTMDSSDNMFVVCAHRYFEIPSTTRYPRGRCFFTTDRALENFQIYAPCENRNFGRGSFGQCLSGTSAILADNDVEASSTTVPIIVGAPGSRNWQGAVFRRRTSGATDLTSGGEGTANHNWQGYSMTKGHFISTTRLDIAVSVPRRNFYRGQVNIIRNNNGLDYEGQTLVGTQQMGEYYGFSLAAVDLNGDGLDELLVGAPMYSPIGVPEAGQVYVYRNNGGNLELNRLLRLQNSGDYVRFGHAITNLGDINGDKLEDVAISAPFGEGSGTVYVYYGSVAELITASPQQVIIGSEVTDSKQILTPSGFGYSLSSSLDVDGNGINDLLVGAYESQQVFLLRSRAVASLPVTLTASPTIVNLETSLCYIDSTSYACFNLTTCANFPNNDDISNNIAVDFTLNVDRQNNELGLQQRVFFNISNKPTVDTFTLNIRPDQRVCQLSTVYIENGIADILNGFPVELSLQGPQFTTTSVDGNPDPSDLSSYPLVVLSGQSFTQVETFKDCNGTECIPDLALNNINVTLESSSGSTLSSFVAGEVANFNFWMSLTNNGDNAYLTTISFSILTSQFEFVTVLPQEFLITCTPDVGTETTVLTCPIANPLEDRVTRVIGIRLRPTSGLQPSNDPYSFTFSATSLNPEMNATLSDNTYSKQITVAAQADIYLDQAVAEPEQVSYMVNITDSNITEPTDLGSAVTVSYVVRNAGPSTVPETILNVFWPLQPSGSELFYLYPSQIQRSISNSIECSEEQYINPLGLTIQSDQNNIDDNEELIGSGRRRRRSISPLKRKRRGISRRQTMEPVEEVTDVTINCRTDRDLCVHITCIIRQLSGGNSVQIDFVSHLDERYFQSLSDRFIFVPYANVSIASGSSNVQQPVEHLTDETEVQIRAVSFVPAPLARDSSVAAWVIIVPVILGLLFFIIIGVVLYFVGFFKLKSKQKKEEIAAQFLEAQQGGDAFDAPQPPDTA